jgi:hypothetical protein
MAGFGDVLRGLGSVLNPQVAQGLQQEGLINAQGDERMQQLMLSQIIKGVESGSIDPAKLQGTPLAGMGPDAQTQARMQAQKQDAAFRQEMTALGPDADHATLAQVAMKYGRPELAVKFAEFKENKAARIAELTQRGEQEIAKVREAAAQNRITKEEADQREARMRQDLIRLTASLRPPTPERNLQLTTDAAGNQLIVNPDGTTRPLTAADGSGVKKAVGADKPMTEFQGKAALYGTRAAQSDKVLKSLEDTVSTTGLALGQKTGMIGNAMMSAEQQRVTQAQRDFVNAVLRQESGAVISDQEFDNAKKQYFPAPGDDKTTLDQKRANRQLAIQGFARMSGPKGAVDIKAIQDEPLLPGVSANPKAAQVNAPAPPAGFKIVPR